MKDTYKRKCSKCKTVFGFTDDDIEVVEKEAEEQRGQYMGFYNYHMWVKEVVICPVCSKEITLTKEKVKSEINEERKIH